MKYLLLTLGLFTGLLAGGGDLWDTVKLAKGSTLQKVNGETVLFVDLPEKDGLASSQSSIKVDLAPYYGKVLVFSCEYRGENIKKAPPRFVGAKFMFYYVANGKSFYPEHMPQRDGTFDWLASSFAVEVPEGAEKGEISLGLQESTGKAEFRNVKFRVVNRFAVNPPVGFRCEYTPAVADSAPWRGVMSPGYSRKITAEDIRDLAKWHANVIRWQFSPPGKNCQDIKEYDKLINDDLDRLEQLLPEFEKAKIKVIYDIHQPPGARMNDDITLGTAGSLAKNAAGSTAYRMFFDQKYVDNFVGQWQKIARRFKDKPIVAGYDLVNEPDQQFEVEFDYLQIEEMAVKAIRAIDPEKPVIITPKGWADASAFRSLQPLPYPNLFYTVHFYYPGAFTHQGVRESFKDVVAGKLVMYPGVIDGKMTDKAALEEYLKPVIDFQKKYGAKIFVGEFSATRWSPGADNYISDCIAIFEKYHWSWCYHAYREWHGWSVEHGENPLDNNPVPGDTARKKVLLKAYELNRP